MNETKVPLVKRVSLCSLGNRIDAQHAQFNILHINV